MYTLLHIYNQTPIQNNPQSPETVVQSEGFEVFRVWVDVSNVFSGLSNVNLKN